MRRSLVVMPFWLMLILARPGSALAAASEQASAATASRWWTLACDRAPHADTKPHACLLIVRLRGEIDRTQLHRVQEAVRRRDETKRMLRRDVRIRVDVDSQGGQVFAAMEIGRILRGEGAAISVARGAACLSACVFVLMGAPERSIADGARIGIHRPALGQARSDAIVAAMSSSIVSYAAQMRVSRTIVSDMMAIPAGRLRFLTIAELDGYGIRVARQ